MANALFAFEDWNAGKAAADDLLARGLPADAVQLHYDTDRRPGHVGAAIDEQVTGGLLANLSDLFRGVIEWGSSPHDASAFEATVRRGGSVLSVDAGDAQQEAMIDAAPAGTGCDRRTPWSAAPTR